MGKLSRDKGAAFERKVARKLNHAAVCHARRNLEEVREGNAGDILCDLPVVIQAKTGKRPPILRAYREAAEAADGTGKYPLAVTHHDQERPGLPALELVTMEFEDWLEIVRALYAGGVW